MSKKIRFYTSEELNELKSLKNLKEITAFAKKYNRSPNAVQVRYYKLKSKERKASAPTVQQRIKSRSQGEFVIPVTSLQLRNSAQGMSLILRY